MNTTATLRYLLCALLMFTGYVAYAEVSIDDVIAAVESPEGALLEVHGVTPNNLFVVTYRGSSFFVYIHLALTTADPDLNGVLRSLHRHDVVRVHGVLPLELQTRGVPHILAFSVERVEPAPVDLGPYERHLRIPQDILGLTTLTAKVHFADRSGRAIIIDYQGAVFPVRVSHASHTKVATLSRGDIIELDFVIGENPASTTHLVLRDTPTSLRVLNSVVSEHETSATIEGDLILFPASPQVRFPVFALKRNMNGIYREYTLLNFADPDLFRALREKLQNAWDASARPAVNDRNKLIKHGLRVRATGRLNFVDPSQANPQVIIESLDNVQIFD